MSKANTRDTLLDAAEYLMARQGYANTSLREITARAEANLAAVNYHFGSKEGLVSAMLSRRLEPLNTQRLSLLDAEMAEARDNDRQPNAETILHALLEPAVTFFQSEDGGKDFLRIFSQIHADPDDKIRQEFLKHMVPLFMRFFEGLHAALPHIPTDTLVMRIFFCIGAMSQSANVMLCENIKSQFPIMGLPPMTDSQTLVEELIGFAVRGMEVK